MGDCYLDVGEMLALAPELGDRAFYSLVARDTDTTDAYLSILA